jgi:hypothetical protein
MKFSAIINNLSISRGSKPSFNTPIHNFIYTFYTSGVLVDFVEKERPVLFKYLEQLPDETLTMDIRQVVRKNYVVSCVSALESYFKDTARDFVDANLVDEGVFELLKQDKFSIAEIKEINKQRISIGEIISVTYTFNRLETINSFFSRVFKINDFISEVEQQKVAIEGMDSFVLKEKYPHFRKEIIDFLNLRHQIIHHRSTKNNISLKMLFLKGKNLIYFVLASDFYITEKLKKRIRDIDTSH